MKISTVVETAGKSHQATIVIEFHETFDQIDKMDKWMEDIKESIVSGCQKMAAR